MARLLLSKNQLSTELGVDRRTLDKRLGDIPPTETAGRSQKYDLKTVFAAFMASAEQEASTRRRSLLPGGGNEDPDLQGHALELASAKLRREVAEAELAEIKVEKARGALIEAERVGDIWDDLAATMRSRMLSLPNRLSVETEGMDRRAVEKRAEELVHEALKELSAPADYNADRNSDADDDDEDAD